MNSKTDKRAFLAGALLALLTVLTLASCSMTDSDPQAHEHRYSDVFSYDESGHWKSAVCGCDNETEDYGKHSFSVTKTVSATFDFGGYTEYTCSICGYSKQDDVTSRQEHSYSSQWTYSSQSHWQECTDKGYEELVRGLGNHVLTEKVIKIPTQTESGLSSFTCNVCGYSYESVVPKTALVISAPSVPSGVYYIGQSLSSIPLVGGEGSVAGSFAWTDPTALLTGSGNYEVTFTPDSDENSPVKLSVSVNAVQLTVSIDCGENGGSDKNGVINVSYGQALDISFIPHVGYAVSSVFVNGAAADADTNFTLEDIRENKNIRVEFKSIENNVEIDCLLGSPDCYTVSNSVLTISGITADTVYSISGEMYGNIVIDVGSTYSFELEMNGFTIYSNVAAPISVLSGDKVTVSAKKGYVNRIYDTRRCESTEYPAAIYSLTDLDVEGKGELILSSDKNGGVYSKKDLNVKNLTLSVKCRDNALRGNDSVTVTHGSITLIATDGDAIKTTNSNISSKGKQRGDVRITDSAVKIYAADDGIDAEHDVIIDGDTTTVNIFTGAFSEYSSTVASTRTDTLYVKLESRDYSCSVKYADGTGNVVWSSSDTVTERTVDGKTCFFYSFPAKADCKKISVYLYKASQQIGQDKEFHACVADIEMHPNADVIELKYVGDSLSHRFASYALTDGESGDVVSISERSSNGIKAGNSISVVNGTINISSFGDAMHASNGKLLENGKSPTGNIIISGGNTAIKTYYTAIRAFGALRITGGKVNIAECYTGLHGGSVEVTGGNTLISSICKKTFSDLPGGTSIADGTVK